MKKRTQMFRHTLLLLAAAWLLTPLPTWGCAACFGASDSSMARGLNMGIFALLAVVGCVFGGALAFVVYLGRKASQAPSAPTDPTLLAGTNESSAVDTGEEIRNQPRFTLP
jgi:hypothetical protein